MKQKDLLWSGISFLIAAVIAVLAFVRGGWQLPLLTGIFIVWGLWVFVTRGIPALRARHSLGKRKKQERKAEKARKAAEAKAEAARQAAEAEIAAAEACPAMAQTLLRHVNHRISDRLRVCCPDARWEWTVTDPALLAIRGGIGRIRIYGVPDYDYADVELDPSGKLSCSLVKALEEHNAAQSPPPDEQALEPQVWYELRGRKVLETLIADLDSRGHNCLILKEDGCICVQPVDGGEETVEDILCDFPGKDCWATLTKVLEQAGLAATAREDRITVAW